MSDLQGELLKEQKKLKNIILKTESSLKNAPEGTLRLAKHKGYVQYYHCLPGGKPNGNYIPVEQKELVWRLAQKSYDQRVLKCAQRRLHQIEKIQKDYQNDEIEQIFLKEHVERQKLIRPVEPTWNQLLQCWSQQKYEGKKFAEGIPEIFTERGGAGQIKIRKNPCGLFLPKSHTI